MSKGKKYTAAEKHFKDKEVIWRRTLREQESKLRRIEQVNRELKEQNMKLETEVMSLKNWVERLLDYMDIDEEDWRRHMKNVSNKAGLVDIIHTLMGGIEGIR